MAELPERASLEYLKKLAKDRLDELRELDPDAKLAAAQLAVAREHGFSSWRALKVEIDRGRGGSAARFFEACEEGDAVTLAELLAKDPTLASAEKVDADYGGWTGLHTAAQAGSVEAARFLLAHGADPNAREAGDDTYLLYWAAARQSIEIIRALLDAGAAIVTKRVRGCFVNKDGQITNTRAYDASNKYPGGLHCLRRRLSSLCNCGCFRSRVAARNPAAGLETPEDFGWKRQPVWSGLGRLAA